ncbi:MAG: hypothetical protein R6V10_13385, partial [bacterium]
MKKKRMLVPAALVLILCLTYGCYAIIANWADIPKGEHRKVITEMNVMVPMRNVTWLAIDIYRPG